MTDVRIVTESLGGSSLSQLLQHGGGDAWLPRAPQSAAEWRVRAEQRRGEGDWRARWRALQPAIVASGSAAERLARVQQSGGVVVTTGQQPGLFGGPVYTWSKAMSTIALADALEAATGIPTAPVFWAATDDADFAEAAATVIALPGGAQALRSADAPPAGTPMSLARLGDRSAEIAALARASGSASEAGVLLAVRDAYGDADTSVGGAFVALLRALLAPLGMPVIDASHPAVAAASGSTLALALARAPEIERALRARTESIRAAGFTTQVEDVAALSLVFVREEHVKRRLSIGEAIRVGDGVLTPNVLLRPIVEHAILPTVAYVAGPGELAYFAQVSAASQAMGRESPTAVPRWSCTLIEPHIVTLLERLSVSPAELSHPHALEGTVARAAMGRESAAALAALRERIAALPTALEREAAALGLSEAVRGGMHALQHRVDRLERRLVAGLKRREAGALRDVATVRAALHPLGRTQERTLNLLPLLARHGVALLDDMCEAAGPHAAALVDAATVATPALAP